MLALMIFIFRRQLYGAPQTTPSHPVVRAVAARRPLQFRPGQYREHAINGRRESADGGRRSRVRLSFCFSFWLPAAGNWVIKIHTKDGPI
jgi:hypothetical protein